MTPKDAGVVRPALFASLAERLAWQTDVGPDCWMWRGRVHKGGYGGITIAGKAASTHRAAWIVFRGPIPIGMCVLHRCDVPLCVNPDHLFLGTLADNNKDRAKKGRSADVRGSKSAKTRLKESDVVTIRQRVASGETLVAVGRDYQITHHAVWRIVHRHNWKHV